MNKTRAVQIAHDYLWQNQFVEEPEFEEYMRQFPDTCHISLIPAGTCLNPDDQGHNVWRVIYEINLGKDIKVHDITIFVDSITGEVWMLGEARPNNLSTLRDREQARAAQKEKNAVAIALLRSWREEDAKADEQTKARWEAEGKTLEEGLAAHPFLLTSNDYDECGE